MVLGKVLLYKLILNLIHKDSGEIFVFGKNNLENQKEWKEQIGIVLDESFFPETSNLKDINSIMKNVYKQWNEDIFFNYIKKFSLSSKKTIKEYSRGMKMKLSIAVALSHNPKLLILDEPTNGLDPVVRDEILDVFLEFIEDESHSIFISSHIISDLEKLCDYITFIHKGNILFTESKDELLNNYCILKCSQTEFEHLDKSVIKGYRKNSFGVEVLVLKEKVKGNFILDKANIEDIMLYHIKGDLK